MAVSCHPLIELCGHKGNQMRKYLIAVLAFLAMLAAMPQDSHAQQAVDICTRKIGANGAANCVDVSSVNPLPVLNSGGGSGGNINVAKSLTPTVTAGAYASGKSLGGLLSFPIFHNAATESGLIDQFSVYSKTGLTVPVTVYLFDKIPATGCTDDTAVVFSSADLALLVTPSFVLTPTVNGVGAAQSAAAQIMSVSTANADTNIDSNLYACVVTSGVTPASSSEYVFGVAAGSDY